MKFKILILFTIIGLLILSIAGCSGYAKGIKETRLLSGEEKAELVKIAVNTDEVKSALENKEDFQVEIGWSLIKWRGDSRNILEIGYYGYDYEEYHEKFEEDIAKGAEIYTAVAIEMGNPIDYGVTVSINPDTLQIVNVITHPITPVR